MPMMRRGPLDRYSPEWVLRQANAHQVEGSIEFHTSNPATFYLDGGRIYAAAEGVGLGDRDLGDGSSVDEPDARQRVVDLLAQVLVEQSGWYFHDPLGHHPGRGAWVWETATLIMDTRAKAHEVTTLASWVDRTVAIEGAKSATITLGTDAWAVVVELAGSASSTELRTSLGWQPDRLLAALNEIEQRGVLVTGPAAPAPDLAMSPLSTAAFPAPPQAALHHTGPLTPPTLPDARTHKRRKLPGRRPAGG